MCQIKSQTIKRDHMFGLSIKDYFLIKKKMKSINCCFYYISTHIQKKVFN